MNKLYFDRGEIASIDALYGKYPIREFASPTRSTVPLLSWLKHKGAAVQKVLAKLGVQRGEFHFEYSVMPELGRGSASMTDLMVLDTKGGSSAAIEAKWTEPRYKTVKDWLREGSSPGNRKLVLESWLGLLQGHAAKKLSIGDMEDVVYQMLHRAASACASGDRPALAYLAFKDERSNKKAGVEQDLAALWAKLGRPAGFPFFYIGIGLTPTAQYEPLLDLPKNITGTILGVVDALGGHDKLFDFETPISVGIQ